MGYIGATLVTHRNRNRPSTPGIKNTTKAKNKNKDNKEIKEKNTD